MSVAVITSIYGSHDQLQRQPPQTVDAEWIAVTDGQHGQIGPYGQKGSWSVVVEPRPGISDRLAAKFAKCCPWYYTFADTIVWIDGAYKFKDEYGLQKLIDWSNGAPIAQYRHYSRDCVYEEAEVSKTLPKYSFQPIDAQMEYYRKLGYPENNGLFAGGIIVRNFNSNVRDKRLVDFGRRWLADQIRWTDQDQLSEMPILWQLHLLPFELPGGLLDNEALTWCGHLKGENR